MRSGLSLLRGNASRRSRGSSARRENYAFCLRTRHSKGRRGNPGEDMGRGYEGKFFRSRSMHDEHCRDHCTFSGTKLRSGIRSTSRIGGYGRNRGVSARWERDYRYRAKARGIHHGCPDRDIGHIGRSAQQSEDRRRFGASQGGAERQLFEIQFQHVQFLDPRCGDKIDLGGVGSGRCGQLQQYTANP